MLSVRDIWTSRSAPCRYARHLRAVWSIIVLAVAIPIARGQATPSANRGESRVVIVRPERKSFDSAVETMRRALCGNGHTVHVVTLPSAKDVDGNEKALAQVRSLEPVAIAAAGETITARVLEAISDTPVVFFMVVNAGSAPFMKPNSPHANRVCGVASDPQLDRQIEWIARMHPDCRKLAILHSERLKPIVAKVTNGRIRRGTSIVAIAASSDAFPEAVERLNKEGCDGVLMLPDTGIYNRNTIKRLILWGLRQKKPVWTFSRNLVAAGALGGLYYDKNHVALRAAETVEEVLAGAQPSAIGVRYPDDIHKALNADTVKQIGLQLKRRDVGGDTEWIER